jgi:PAS domain-containing protein
MTALALPLNELTENAPVRLTPPARPMSRLFIPLVRLESQVPASTPSVAPRPAPVAAAPGRGNDVLAPWAKLVEDSPEPAFVLDASGTVVAASARAAELLGEFGPDQVVGHHLLDVVDLVDFHGGPAGAVYTDRLAPLLAMAGDVLTRGLLRVRFPDDTTRTLDAVASPLHDAEGRVVGTIAFLASIWS